ncbi:MAG: hypothetical protein ACRC7N_04315, partial [Clostridium sp.]
MATKLSNEHLDKIILDSKNYHIIDVYIALAHISSEVKGKYLIQTYTDKKTDLVNQVMKYVKVCYKTISNNIDKLIELKIISYDIELSSWTLINMENMTKSKNNTISIDPTAEYKGYTTIREFFLSSAFHQMKAIEKRCLVYLAQLCDSKAAKSYNNFVMNLFKPNSKWMTILKTKCRYYAKYTIQAMLSKYEELFIDNSDELRSNDISPSKISSFKFAFSCNVIEKVENDNSQYELLSLYNAKELELVKSKINFAGITLTKVNILHIVRAVATIKEWFLKERVVQIIINKYIAIQI